MNETALARALPVEPYGIWADPSVPDADLSELVQFANAFSMEIGVLLTLPGQVIGGVTISGERHWAELATQVRGGDPENTPRGALASRLASHALRYRDWAREIVAANNEPRPDEERIPLPPVAYIHLRDAYVVDPMGLRDIGLWRGRLSEVVGWTVGSFKQD